LSKAEADVKAIQETLFAAPKYKARNRKRHKYTEAVDTRLKAILKEEARKDRLFGSGHKQKLTNKQIHQKLADEGFDISGVTINIALADLRKREKEVFIRQQYEYGDRLEYDFGEVLLDCGEGIKTYTWRYCRPPEAVIGGCICTQIRKKLYSWTAMFVFSRW